MFDILMCRYEQMSRYLPDICQDICPDISRHIQTYLDIWISRHIQTYLDIQTYPDISRHIQTYPDCRHVQDGLCKQLLREVLARANSWAERVLAQLF